MPGRYRDWVVKSFQDDLPWDRFIQEQLAGDELAAATQESTSDAINDSLRRDQLVATAFLRLAPDGTGDPVPDQNLARNQAIAEQLKVTTSALLGLTVACAQCHDHRYDPVSQADYFRLRAIFDPVYDWEQWRLPGARVYSLYKPEERAAAAAIEAEAAKIDAAADAMRKAFLDEIFETEIIKLPEEVRDAYRTARATPEGERTEEHKGADPHVSGGRWLPTRSTFTTRRRKKPLTTSGRRGRSSGEPSRRKAFSWRRWK